MAALDQFSLSERTIVITGATSGIGESLALACAEAGACVCAVGRNCKKLEDLGSKLAAISDKPHCTQTFDVTDFEKIPLFIQRIVEQCGKINGFIHCAGIAENVPLKIMTSKVYEDSYRVNVIAGYEFIKEISKKKNLNDDKGASYILISSVSALKGEAGLLAYSASKGAILSGVRSLAVELARKNIRVNCIVPGLLPDTAMGRKTVAGLSQEAAGVMENKHLLGFGRTEYLTGPAIFLLSEASRWMTGAALQVDGGYTL